MVRVETSWKHLYVETSNVNFIHFIPNYGAKNATTDPLLGIGPALYRNRRQHIPLLPGPKMYKIYTRHFHLQNPRARFLLVWDNILRGGSSTIHLLPQVYCPIFLNSRSQGCKAPQLGRLLYLIQIKECLVQKINLGQVVINAGWGPERYSKWPRGRQNVFSIQRGLSSL